MNLIIETPRLILKEFSMSDVDNIYRLDSSIEVNRYLGNNPIKSKDEALGTISSVREQYEKYGTGRLCVFEKEKGIFLGWSGIKFETNLINGFSNYYDLGYRFCEEYWGMGYATETAYFLLEHAYNKMGIKEIFARTEIGNKASQHVLDKIGFVKKNVFFYEGVDNYWFEINIKNGK